MNLLDLDAVFDNDRAVPPRPAPPPADLTPEWREEYEERAAVMEFDANLPRELAERYALREVLRLMKGVGV